MDTRQLTHVVALADRRSYHRAAEVIGISQSALSKSIQGLEDHLGLVLFERSRRGVAPTDAGRLLVTRARELLFGHADLARELSLLRSGCSGELAVGAGPYAVELVVGPALARLLGPPPSPRVSIDVSHWLELLRQLRLRRLDMFVAELSELEDGSDLLIQPLNRHQGYFVTRRAHPLAANAAPTMQEILSYPVVMASKLPRRLVSPLLEGRDPPQKTDTPVPAVQCDSVALMRLLVANSDVIGAFPLTLVERELRERTLVVLPFFDSRFCTSYGIVLLKARTLSPIAERFLQLLKDAEEAMSRREAELQRSLLPHRRAARTTPSTKLPA
jgi:DNA-binding transcriptional LysR family regulator